MFRRILHSAAFRLALIFAAVFAGGAITLVVLFDAAVRTYAEQSTRRAIQEETSLLLTEAQIEGPDDLRQLLVRRQANTGAGAFSYLLLDAQGRRITGVLPLQVAKAGPSQVTVAQPPDPGEYPSRETSTLRTFGVLLSDGSLLVVGRDSFALDELSEWVDRVTIWSGCGIAILALIAGFLISAIFLSRLERLNGAASRIMEGRLDERLPVVGMGNEFNHLSVSLNAMLDRIQALMEGLRQVSTDIAHDLRTPLNRLRQGLEAARSKGSEAVYEHAIDDALGQLDQVLETFSALLRIGQIEGGVGRARFTEVDLSELMERVGDAYQPAAEDRGKTITARIECGVWTRGDREMLAQVFANLVDNAIIHSGEGSGIELCLVVRGELALASVMDNGPGIPESERDKVLRRFYRLDASRTTPGSGLGLSLTAAIAELHGVHLTLIDNAPGLRAEIVFPVLAGDRSAHSASGTPSSLDD